MADTLQSAVMGNILGGRSLSGMEFNPQRFIDRVTNATEGQGSSIAGRFDLPTSDLNDLVALQQGIQGGATRNPSASATTWLANKLAAPLRIIPGAKNVAAVMQHNAAEAATGAGGSGLTLTPRTFRLDPRPPGIARQLAPLTIAPAGLLGREAAD
jgi:hypothetical protein